MRAAALGLLMVLAGFAAAPAAGSDGLYSSQAVQIWPHVAQRQAGFVVASPDGRSTVTAKWHSARHSAADDEGVTLAVRGAGGGWAMDLGPGVDSELAWSPDSRRFFVTTSDGGNVGVFRLLVGDRGRAWDVSGLVRKTFGHPVRCGEVEPPNVAGIGWLPNGHLLAAAQIMPHSVCDSMGTFRAYEIDVALRRVVKTYDQLQAKSRFRALLGLNLRAATDACIRDPRSCYTSTNHPDLHR